MYIVTIYLDIFEGANIRIIDVDIIYFCTFKFRTHAAHAPQVAYCLSGC